MFSGNAPHVTAQEINAEQVSVLGNTAIIIHLKAKSSFRWADQYCSHISVISISLPQFSIMGVEREVKQQVHLCS